MSLSEAKPYIVDAIENRESVLLSSQPGIGKTTLFKDIAKELDYNFLFCSAALKDIIDIKGMPAIQNGKFGFITLDSMQKLIDAKKPTIFLIDDLGWAVPSIQLIIGDLILTREINGQKISDFVSIVSATNRVQDRSGVNPIPEATKSRFNCIIPLRLDIDAFISYGLKIGIDESILAFSKLKPEYLDFKPCQDIIPSITPRTLEFLSKKIKRFQDINVNLVSTVCGYEYAIDYINFKKIYNDLPNLNEILTGVLKKTDFSLDVLYLVIVKLINKIDFNNINTAWEWVNKLHGEMQALFITLCQELKRNELQTSDFYAAWLIQNQEKTNF